MVNADARLDLLERAEGLRYMLAMPLIADNRMLGVLAMYNGEPFGESPSRRVEMIAPHLATALATVDATPVQKSSRELRVVARR